MQRTPRSVRNILICEARVTTSSASRYLVQLGKHWSHKFPVEYTPEIGQVPFGPDRIGSFTALPDALVMRIEAADQEGLEQLQRVIADHLRRFAFREADLPQLHWTRLAPATNASARG